MKVLTNFELQQVSGGGNPWEEDLPDGVRMDQFNRARDPLVTGLK